MVGEASLSLATACYGSSMNGNNGHGPHDVLYLAFPGSDAVPGAGGAAWNAKSFDEFHKSLESDGLKAKLEKVEKDNENLNVSLEQAEAENEQLQTWSEQVGTGLDDAPSCTSPTMPSSFRRPCSAKVWPWAGSPWPPTGCASAISSPPPVI